MFACGHSDVGSARTTVICPPVLSSAADWQRTCNLFQPGQWLHVVGEYSVNSTPSVCDPSQPGFIKIWVNGVLWNMAVHAPTGCMSQYHVVPAAASSPLNIGTMAYDAGFQGAIGKVAIYNYLLDDTQVRDHYTAMTGKQPTGSCGIDCTF
ncbi:hypothetical protein LMG28614_06833 [Paraburkholderia ultramafica]|uniref:LamG domain-containing protein n=2 Tax=Paraburkholderia ultramafica TaxID=1544867 RepID=A0A6S7BPF4_9BURK|nr:hypothetical protein LMG28614_06833 [Paraburkholderia ultramafica]